MIMDYDLLILRICEVENSGLSALRCRRCREPKGSQNEARQRTATATVFGN